MGSVSAGPDRTQGLCPPELLRGARDHRIDHAYAQPLDVGSLARGAQISAGHFGREFRPAYGESPYGADRG
jgi:AraC-like DNA-binding protein